MNNSRYERWRKLNENEVKNLSLEDRNQIKATLLKYGKDHLSNERIRDFQLVASKKLSDDNNTLILIIVAILGALTFSVLPSLIAKNSGRGIFSMSMGLIGGSLATLAAHNSATKVLTDIKLKNNTTEKEQSILKEE